MKTQDNLNIKKILGEIDTLLKEITNKRNELAQAIGFNKKIDEATKKINTARKKSFHTYSLNIDKKDYDKLEKVARKEKMSISKFIKTKYWEYFMQGGPNIYNTEYEYMAIDVANRPQSGAVKTIAMALDDAEEENFNNRLLEWNISLNKKRDIMKFFIIQFLYGSYKMQDKNRHMKWKHCQSSCINAYGYDGIVKSLYLKFNTGLVYAYFDVPPNVYKGLDEAESKGRYHSQYLINKYDYEKIK